jgi:hypothetical protein
MKKIWIIVLSLVVLIGIGVTIAYVMFNKKPDNLADKKPDIVIDAPSLVIDYSQNLGIADSTYLNKIIEVSGIVEQASKSTEGAITILLTGVQGSGVSCNIPPKDGVTNKEPQIGDSIVVRGQCTGFLMDVVLSNASFVEKKK